MNTKIQTAGEQKYYDFVQKEAERLRLGMIIWVSMLAAALISVFENVKIAVLLALIGIVLAGVNIRKQQKHNKILERVKDKKEFYLQLTADDMKEWKELGLIICKDYVLCKTTDIHVCCLSNMVEVEVEADKSAGKKMLFLIDTEGERNEIVSCIVGSQTEKMADEVSDILQRRLPVTVI